VEESLANEQLRARGMVVRKEGTMQFAPPFKFSDFDFEVSRPAPKPGEHTDEVLREAGYDRTKIDQLRRNEVVS
jgi:crotonobetainyl-CoA:carnitine CoA-transferase CaiB-like acyl-CoA transferase